MAQEAQAKAAVKMTTFSFHDPQATAVFLAGTFNDWNPNATAMERSSTGEWNVELNLEPGQYEYKFVVDGQWCCHPGCSGHVSADSDSVPNAFGTFIRVLEVS